MAAPCLGSFGAYKLAYNQYKKDLDRLNFDRQRPRDKATVTWVQKRYDPLDLRHTAPLPLERRLLTTQSQPINVPRYWLPPTDVPPRFYYKDRESRYASQPCTRCEEWSTLRQMLPSRGTPITAKPPENWGTGQSYPPIHSAGRRRSFHHINSPMTRYVDAMHGSNPMFRLH